MAVLRCARRIPEMPVRTRATRLASDRASRLRPCQEMPLRALHANLTISELSCSGTLVDNAKFHLGRTAALLLNDLGHGSFQRHFVTLANQPVQVTDK